MYAYKQKHRCTCENREAKPQEIPSSPNTEQGVTNGEASKYQIAEFYEKFVEGMKKTDECTEEAVKISQQFHSVFLW